MHRDEEEPENRSILPDYTAALEEAERLKLAYRDASDAFMEHWQQDHHVRPMAASASSNR
jgi:hypothetical protein